MTGGVVLVLGAAGQLGSACLVGAPKHTEAIPLTRDDFDLSDYGQLQQKINYYAPRCIINAAAYTSVDLAEEEPDLAMALNFSVPAALSTLCAQHGIRLIHVSTDFVFDGAKGFPYKPSDITSPVNMYGVTKLKGERAVAESGANHAILRTSWLYSQVGHNFVLTMLRLMQERSEIDVVSDQVGSPTFVSSLAQVCWALAWDRDARGIFHWSDLGEISWYEFARAIAEEAFDLGLISNLVSVKPIMAVDYPSPARRPSYSALDASLTCEKIGVLQVPWRQALRRMLCLLKNRSMEMD